jgi:hypothetical protein
MSTTEEAFDPTRRRLCPDGACVGLLDESGRCRVCGRTESGEASQATAAPEDVSDGGAEAEATGEAEAAFAAGRKLCPDGACIGVVGADGRCKVCGREG